MKRKRESGLDFIVDQLTNSIENVVTGDSFPTEVSILMPGDLKIFPLLIATLFALCSFAQDQHLVDSLETQLKNHNATKLELQIKSPSLYDTTAVNILHQLSKVYWNNNPGKAMEYANQTLALSEQIGYKKGIGNAYSSLGVINMNKGDYLSAIELFKKSLKISEATFDKNGTAASYDYLGTIYRKQGYYVESMQNHLASLKIQEAVNDKNGIASSYQNIGIIYILQENYPEAIKNLSIALKIQTENHNKKGIADAFGNLGWYYGAQNCIDESIENTMKALKIFEEIGDKQNMSLYYNNLGFLYNKKHNYTKAMDNLMIAVKLSNETGDKTNIAETDETIGETYLAMNDYVKALTWLNKGLKAANDIGSKKVIKESYLTLAKVYALSGDYKKAYQYYNLYTEISELIDKESSTQTAVMQMQFDFDKKQVADNYEFEKKQQADSLQHVAENKINEIKIQRQRMYAYAGFTGAGMIAIFLFFVFRQRNKIAVIRREQHVRRRLASDLHDDIGSTLSSISYYSEAIRKQVKESSPQVLPLLEKMEAASDNTVDAMSDIVWTTNPFYDKGIDLLNRMRTYAADVCDLRNVSLEFETNPSFEKAKLNMETRRNLFLIFKEAVNNALKYSGCTSLKVSIGQEIIKIQDNGKGFDTGNEFSGNGLKNMQQRAIEMKGRLDIQSSGDSGTLVAIKF